MVKSTLTVNIPCAGCVVLHRNEVCLISTHRCVFGFPKGTRDPGEDLLACALRELEEKAGIRRDHIRPLNPDRYVDEPNRKGTK